MKHLHSSLLTALLLLLALPSAVAEEMAGEQAEGYKVTGLVTDQTDQPLPGVTIIAKEDHKIACYSDVNGAFTLHIPYSRADSAELLHRYDRAGGHCVSLQPFREGPTQG